MIETSATQPNGTAECHGLQQRYEELRAQAAGEVNDQGRRGYGLSLFLDQGMVAWIKAWSSLSGKPDAPTTSKPNSSSNTVELVSDSTSGLLEFQNQLATLLAGVALQIARTTTATPNSAT